MTDASSSWVVIGGGVIGLSIAWQHARLNDKVIVIDSGEKEKQASYAAAGMLAPFTEAAFPEEELTQLGRESLALYPRFLEELYQDSGIQIPIEQCGTLFVATKEEDSQWLSELGRRKEEQGATVTRLTRRQARDLAPLLTPRLLKALHIADEGHIDARLFLRALKQAFLRRGGTILTASVNGFSFDGDPQRVVNLSLRGSGSLKVDKVIVATGGFSALLPLPELKQVQPVKGQILNLRLPSQTCLKQMIRGRHVYLVPKGDGHLRIGATSEEQGYDRDPTAGGMLDLLREGWELLPALYEAKFADVAVGLRPVTPSRLPLIRPAKQAGLYYATGHGRGGILLAPYTAKQALNWRKEPCRSY